MSRVVEAFEGIRTDVISHQRGGCRASVNGLIYSVAAYAPTCIDEAKRHAWSGTRGGGFAGRRDC